MDVSINWVVGWILLAIILVPVQLRIAAPYGRHTRKGWGPLIPNRIGWIAMEASALMVFAWAFMRSGKWTEVTILLAMLFTLHYIHRSVVFPLMTRTSGKRIPVLIVLFAIGFNVVNGYINGDYLGSHPAQYPMHYFRDIRFILGGGLFVLGAAVNIWADYKLIGLRRTSADRSYKIPQGGLFNYVSCPNHLGELVEWTGFAVMCWSLPALAFAVWTAANLIPRAWHHHRWYSNTFEDYPQDRRAIIPYIM